MSRFVIDASVVLTWCFPDEHSQKATEISEQIATGNTPVVPTFWCHELLNALLVGERRNRLTPELTKAFLQDVEKLSVEVDASSNLHTVFLTIQDLCRRHRLTAYDAAYLEIALREACPLATVDDDLALAARAEGVQVL